MLNTEAEKILSDAMMTLGLQDDRVKTIFRLMEAVGYAHVNMHQLPEQPKEVVSIKYVEELDTDRQRLAFRDWWEQKTRTSHPMNVAYGMFIEHIKAKNEFEIEIDQLLQERDFNQKWADKLANKISEVTGTDIYANGDHSWATAIDALIESSTRTTPKVKAKLGKPTAWLSVLPTGDERISTSLDIAKEAAGEGVVFGLWKDDEIDVGLQKPKAWHAYCGVLTYLIQDLASGAQRYPNVHKWTPLYLERETDQYIQEMFGQNK